MGKGYVIVFPQGTILPNNLPTPGPRTSISADPGFIVKQPHNNLPDKPTYIWQSQQPVGGRQSSENTPTQESQSQSANTQTPPKQDKLARLAKQLAIPKTSRFEPAPVQHGRQLRNKVHESMSTLQKVGEQIARTPSMLKDAYLRSGEHELARLNDVAIEIFYRNQRKQEAQKAKERAKQEQNERIFLSQLIAHRDRTVQKTTNTQKPKGNDPELR